MQSKIWFITGVSTGLGRELATQVALTGDIVIGTVRKQEQLEGVNNLVVGKTFGYLLDINHHVQVQEVIKAVIEKFGKIDVLVNNAGYGLFGTIEAVSIEETRQQMETNFFSALAVTQAVLHSMKANKSGYIFQISSIAGLVGRPGLGIYNASKFALEGFSEALYHEVKAFNIKVTLIEPGPFRTLWAGASMQFAAKQVSGYEESADKTKMYLDTVNGSQPGDPVRAAKALIQLTQENNPPLRLALGKIAVGVVQSKIDMLTTDLKEWQALSVSADFPVE
jgi:short-subunit dehydrogenase